MKKFLLVLTAIMLVFAVVGCNSNGAPTTVVDKSKGDQDGDKNGEQDGDKDGDKDGDQDGDKGPEFTISNLAFAQGGSADPTTGKGNIEGDDFAKIKAAKAGSFVRITFDINDYDDKDSVGWGFGKAVNGDNTFETSHPGFVEFKVTAEAAAKGYIYSNDYDVADLLKGTEPDHTWIFLNVWSGAKITKVELHAKN